MVTDFLQQKCLKTIRQVPYSPDFNLLDRWLFSKLENMRAKQSFQTPEELEEFLSTTLRTISKASFTDQSEKLKKDLTAVIEAHGCYL